MANYSEEFEDSGRQPSLWTDRSRRWIAGLIFMLMAGNVFFQFQTYSLGAGLIMPVLAGQVLGVFVPLLILSRNNHWLPLRDLRLERPPWILLLAAAVLAVASLVPTSLLAQLSMHLFESDPEHMALFQNSLPRSGWGLPLTVLTVVVVGPLGEEIVFRGLLHRLASEYGGPAKATLLASLVFALFHAEPWLLLGLLGIAVALSFLFEATGSLMVCWVYHAMHNAVALAMMYLAPEAQTAPAAITGTDLLWLAVSLLTWLWVGTWLYRGSRTDST